jgi:hypothetical protein
LNKILSALSWHLTRGILAGRRRSLELDIRIDILILLLGYVKGG